MNTHGEVQAEQTRIGKLDEIVRLLLWPDTPRRRSDNVTPFPLADAVGAEHAAILDCGCNGGSWIDRMLEEHNGNHDITGVDIFFGAREEDEFADTDSSVNGNGENGNSFTPVQDWVQKRWNLNASFRDDRSDDHLRPEEFDLINSRYLMNGIDTERWPGYVRDLKNLLKYGGWLQMVEIQLPFIDSSGRLGNDSALERWWRWYQYCLGRMNRKFDVGRHLEGYLRQQNLSRVRARTFNVSIGGWDGGDVAPQAEIGAGNLEVAEQMLESLSLYSFLHPQIGQMSEENYRDLIAAARAELRDPQFQLYYKIHIVDGQRPRRIGESSRSA